MRAYLNEGGRLLYTGRSAGWQFANAFDYNPVSTPPLCDNVDQTVDDGCLLLSDDFLQYWLGALTVHRGRRHRRRDRRAGPARRQRRRPVRGTRLDAQRRRQRRQPPPERRTWHDPVVPHHEQPAQAGRVPAVHQRLARDVADRRGGGVQPAHRQPLRLLRPSRHHVQAPDAHDRPHRVGARGEPRLSFWTSFDTEADWDFLFVEAHTVGQDDWTTLPGRERPHQPEPRRPGRRQLVLVGMAHRSQQRDPSVPRPLPDVERRRRGVRSGRHDGRVERGVRALERLGGLERRPVRLRRKPGRGLDLVRQRLGVPGHRRRSSTTSRCRPKARPSRSRPGSAPGRSPDRRRAAQINANDWTRHHRRRVRGGRRGRR